MMDQLGGSGDVPSNHLCQTYNNIPVPLDIFLKDKEILSSEGPFASDLKRSSSSLQTTNEQILAQHQCNSKSTVSVPTLSGQNRNNGWSAMLSRKNCPQQESKHVCSNDRPPEPSAILEKSLLQICPNQMSSSSSKCQNVLSASTTTNASQQFMQHMIVLPSSTGTVNVQNILHNQQPHVKVIDNLHKDSILQEVLTGGGYFGVLLTQTQMIKPCQQHTCMPKDIYQQQHAPQKATAVVSPLNQQLSVTVSKDPTEVEGSLQKRYVLSKNDHQSYIPPALQSTANDSGVKALHGDTTQTKKMASESVLICGFSKSVNNNKLTGQSERLSSVPLNSVSMKEVQHYPADDSSRATFHSEDNAAVIGRNSRRDNLSTLPVNEWSLQRLKTLVNELEQMQKKQQKDVPFNDLSKEILKSYWNGDYKTLYSATYSVYVNIMKEVQLHCGGKNSIILQEVSRERLNEIASTVHILEHGTAPPKIVYTSSCLNLSRTLCGNDKEHGSLSTLITSQSKPKISDKDAPVKEMENTPDPTNKNMKTSNKALNGGETQRKQLPLKQLQNSSVKSDIVVRKEPVVMDVGKTCSVKETGCDVMTEKEVLMNRGQLEKQDTKDENEASSLVSLNTQSQDVSVGCINTKAPINDLTPVLDEIGFVDNTKKDDDAQVLTDPKVQVTVELFDKDQNRTDTKMKSDEMRSRIKIYWQLEHYCCPRKWFQHLGYRNKGLCRCEKKAELSHHADSSGKGSKKVKSNEHKNSFHKHCKLIDCNICVMRGKRRAKKRLENRRMTKKNDNDDDASVNEIEIVDVFTDYEDVLKMANAISEQLKERDATTGREHCRDHHKEITKPKSKIQGTKLHLALFGTSHLRQKKKMSGFTSSDMLPPETINVRLNSGCSEYPPKQQVWNSWKESYVPLKTSTKQRSKTKKRTKTSVSKNDAEEKSGIKITAFDLSSLMSHEDTQTHHSEAKHKNASSLAPTDKRKHKDANKSKKKAMKNISFTRRDQLMNLERRKFLPSYNRNKRWNCTHRGTKLKKSSFESTQDINTNKNKSNMESTLHFGVLPESFNISDGGLSIEANQCAVADSGSTVKTVLQIKRIRGNSVDAWCVSPRKKLCFPSRPTQSNTSEPSTFQEFKKKYEEKKQRIPI